MLRACSDFDVFLEASVVGLLVGSRRHDAFLSLSQFIIKITM